MMTFFVKTPLTLEFCFATIGPTFPKRKEAAVMTKTTKKAMNTMMTAACAGAAFCCACAASHTVIPVSYTHLDVYKRQVSVSVGWARAA